MPDDPRPPHWTWLLAGPVAGLCALALVAARTTRARVRRAVHRARVVVGAGLIDAGVALTPDAPGGMLDEVAGEARVWAIVARVERERLRARVERERLRARVNGRHEGPI